MHIDPAFLGATSALLGALIGGGGSLAAAAYTQTYQDRSQRVVREITKREAVYTDFIMNASKLLLNAYVSDGFTLNGDEQHLIGLANRMRLFAPPNVIEAADAVIRGLVEISLKPSVDLRKLTMADVSQNSESVLLQPFSLACRADLDATGSPIELRGARRHALKARFVFQNWLSSRTTSPKTLYTIRLVKRGQEAKRHSAIMDS